MLDQLRNLKAFASKRPHIEMRLVDSSRNEHCDAFTTFDRIRGVVSITSSVDMPFHCIRIEFVGLTKTLVEKIPYGSVSSAREQASHTFLRLHQPDLQRFYPQDMVLHAGLTYDLPIDFVVPDRLLPQSCRHDVGSDAVEDAHLCLPPTLGDDDKAWSGLRYDMSPSELASIRYRIRATVNTTAQNILAVKEKAVRMIPVRFEDPPGLTADDHESHSDAINDYVTKFTKSVRKNMLKSASGHLTASTSQPPSIHISAVDASSSTTTTLAVDLRYDPSPSTSNDSSTSSPPSFSTVTSKLETITFHASRGCKDFPSSRTALEMRSVGKLSYMDKISTLKISNVEWRRHDQHYTATLQLPIGLPTTKSFVPTFHSCLVSRIYIVRIELNYEGGSLDLSVPLQIASQRDPDTTTYSIDEEALTVPEYDEPLGLPKAVRTGKVDSLFEQIIGF